ncbi:Retrovirus-related Pol polyprotein from transposon 17.6 [Portunus trituberculatus]|uniref:Retrovirus-related Pol polyprotein from transposon 17.6 n=1 Tax=Portunus trituberculatus TaxID=210409 RepID=A0A5B7GI81_PORTR|nr:Retrovirus-related Pol polyprotein from transposon 17.6 [Portunus trituberculatus]
MPALAARVVPVLFMPVSSSSCGSCALHASSSQLFLKASKITSSLTKFNYAVSQLPSDVLLQVIAVISTSATADNPYEELKTTLLKSLQSSVASRLRELLSKEELRDEKPSQLLHSMKQLLGDKYHSFDAELFKQLFYQRLLSAIQRSLFSVKDNLHPDNIGTLADDYTATLPPSQAYSVSAVSSGSSHSSQMTHLTELASQLTTEVAQLKQQLRDHPRSRPVSLRGRQHRSRSSSPGLCWYHQKFGEKALKSTAPFNKTSNSKGEQRCSTLPANNHQRCSTYVTGADINILPDKALQRDLPPILHLYAANGTKIPVYSRLKVQVNLGLRRSFDQTFYVGEVSQAIIGADLLVHYNLLVDIKGRRLIDPLTSISFAQPASGDSTHFTVIQKDHQFATLLRSFPTLTQLYTAELPIKHHVTHHIETSGPLVHAKARRLAPERYRQAKAEFESLVRQGIIRPSRSNWSFALHIVEKKNGDIRPCGDYCALNSRTKEDRYPVPHIQEFSSQLAGFSVFSRIDLIKAFH